jgi:alpha-tubulin suppressor-like RCC1 family protein
MVQIPAPVRFTRVFCRENGLHVLALDTQATLWGFGDNFFGELATGSGGGAQPRTAVIPETPIQRVTQKRWRDVAVGQGFTVAIAADGSLWSWGNNASAALGTGNQDNSSTPRLVDDRQRWAAVAAGEDSAMGLTAEGTLYTWGTNNDGALGDGVDTNVHATPTRVFGKQRWAVPAASRAVQPR